MKIELLGTSFTIRSDEDPAHLDRVLSCLKEKLSQVTSSVRTQDPLKIAILAGLLLSDECIKLSDASAGKSEPDPAEREVEATATQLINKLIEQIDELV